MAAEVELEHCHEYPAHYKVMMDKLNEQRQLDQFTDITLIVDGQHTDIAFLFMFCPKLIWSYSYVLLSYFHLPYFLQDTSSEPTKPFWLHVASFSTSFFRILNKSQWWR